MTTTELNDREQLRQEIVQLRADYEACRERCIRLLTTESPERAQYLVGENERLMGELELALLDLAAVEDLPKRELMAETREHREAITKLTAERDKFRDTADRRQGQFDRLKASFDEVVKQRDERGKRIAEVRENLLVGIEKLVEAIEGGYDVTEMVTGLKGIVAENRQAGEGK